MKEKEDILKAHEFCNRLRDDIKNLLYKEKILPHLIIAVLTQEIYNIHRTCETHFEDLLENYPYEIKAGGKKR